MTDRPMHDVVGSPTRTGRAPLLVASLVAAALTIAGCSSDGDSLDVPGVSATPPTTVPSPTTVAPTTTAAPATTLTPATTVAPTAPPTTVAPTAPPTTALPTTLPVPDGPYYRAGDEGPEIALIQQKLELVNFLDPGYTQGVFDRATNQAVLEFQGQYGLIVDGVVGPATDLALTAAAASVAAD